MLPQLHAENAASCFNTAAQVHDCGALTKLDMLHMWLLCCLQVEPGSSCEIQESNQLLQLTGSALSLVLQGLDQPSLACTAVSCSQLSQTVAASITSVTINHTADPDRLASLMLWFARHGSSIKQCSIVGDPWPGSWGLLPELPSLPCPQLRQLSLKYLDLQLQPTYDSPRLLDACTSLTALEVEGCTVEDAQAAFDIFAALPELRSFRISGTGTYHPNNSQSETAFGDLQPLSKLTHSFIHSFMLHL
jgi:hypothetical protein